ncbi:hypothetical protein [Gordonia sp. 852002-50395_SCH5434458]|uniref:hypothetical protein n=1 Tax=Gordonia sp. 852002-50395_SCH5434458 TaxID=1834090 RepID=UPI0007EB8D69|nr:hypothetical protein [Gordonia sp. 852002-50395_SCH5434458]OBC01751.1 hypothetical protein A5785_17280 [Gordonia sp. 852002-50395_SCH5434458]
MTTILHADEVTLLVTDRPASASITDTYPIDLADRDEAREALADLRRDGALTLVGIEFDDPEEVNSRIVLRGADLAAAAFVDRGGHRIDADRVLDRFDELAHVELTEA